MMGTQKIHTKHEHTCTRARDTRVYQHSYASKRTHSVIIILAYTDTHMPTQPHTRAHRHTDEYTTRTQTYPDVGMLGKGVRESRKGEREEGRDDA